MRVVHALAILIVLTATASAGPKKRAPKPAPPAAAAAAAAAAMPEPSWLDDLCKAKNPRACMEVAANLAKYGGGGGDHDAVWSFLFACNAGDEPEACNSLMKLVEAKRTGGFDLAQERAALVALCDRGDARGCHALATMYMLGLGGPVDHAQGHAIGVRACAKDAWTCSGLAWPLDGGVGVAVDKPAAVALYRKACDAGNLAGGCRVLAAMLIEGDGVKADPAEAARLRERACKAGDGLACWQQAGNGKDAAAVALHRRACTLGVVAGCVSAARLLAPQDRQAAALLYASACYARQACGELAALVAASSPRDALPIYERACGDRDAAACTAGGELAVEGGGDLTADPAHGRTLLRQGCDLGDPEGCGALGLVMVKGIGGAADAAGGVAFIQQACDGGLIVSCGDLGVAYAQGLGGEADALRAKALFDKACAGGHAQSCEAAKTLAQGSTAGGAATGGAATATAGGAATAKPARDPYADARANRTAADAAAKACDAKPTAATCAEAGRRYLRWGELPTVPTDARKAAVYLEKACAAGDAPSCIEASRPADPARKLDDAARTAFLQRACDLGAGEGCVRVAEGLRTDTARQEALYRRACDLQYGFGCVMLGAGAEAGWKIDEAVVLYRKACDLDDVNGCVLLADHLASGQGVDRDVAQARALYDRACRRMGASDSSCKKRDALK